MKQAWFVYIIQCKDKTLYTGMTNDLPGRLARHDQGKACKYTRGRGPVRLVRKEKCASRSLALVREAQIKKLTREQKIKLIGR